MSKKLIKKKLKKVKGGINGHLYLLDPGVSLDLGCKAESKRAAESDCRIYRKLFIK